jgi:hypothetical protein
MSQLGRLREAASRHGDLGGDESHWVSIRFEQPHHRRSGGSRAMCEAAAVAVAMLLRRGGV